MRGTKPVAKGPEKNRKPKGGPIAYRAHMERKTWAPLAAAAALVGPAAFLKSLWIERFKTELFGTGSPELRRFQGPANERQAGELPLSTVLDELRTPSFFSPSRLVIVERAAAFIAEHGDGLVRFLGEGFGGGHLILLVDGKLDGRTRFAKALAESGWIVECAQPFDRPPPWETNVPAWQSELTHWVVERAATKRVEMSPQVAFFLHDRAGTDLATLDEELEKLSTLLASRGEKQAEESAILEVVGDLREDSIFQVIELLLEGKRVDAVEALGRLFERGVHTDRGALTVDAASISLLFLGALLPRLRALRRAHAMSREGQGAAEWVAAGIVQRPFLARFQRQLRAVPPAKLVRWIDRLYDVDRAIKSGGPPEKLLELLAVEFGAAG